MGKSLYFKYVSLYFVIVLTGLMLWFSASNSVNIHILAMIILCLVAIFIAEFNLIHPYFWFSAIFTIYSIGYPILYKYDYIFNYGYSKELIILQWIALTIFLLSVSPKKVTKEIKLKIQTTSLFNKQAINILSITLIVMAIIISGLGFANKKEIYATGNMFLLGTVRMAILLTILYMYNLIFSLIKQKKVDKLLLLKGIFPIFLITMYTGERDLLFRVLVITLLILYVFKKINNKHLLVMIPLGVIGLPMSHIYKYYFLTGVITSSVKLSLNNVFLEFLNGEFISASRNLQILLNNSDYTKGLFQGKTILNDFIRIIYPTGFTHGEWYNSTFFPDVSTTGYGFTLVGQGYINWGYFGVILLFLFLGLFVRYLYHNSYNNIYTLVIYLYSIAIILYSIRADIGNIISPFLKHLLLSMILIKFVEILFNKYDMTKKVDRSNKYGECNRRIRFAEDFKEINK